MLLSQDILFLVLLIILIWLGALTFFVYRMIAHYRYLTKGVNNADLTTILEKIILNQDSGKKKIQEIVEAIEKVNKESRSHIQKLGIVRFNPFSETGGNQSFALALLDEEGSGFVISSLHSRESTRIYAKPIEKSKPVGYDLSKEEKEAIVKAQG